MRHARPFAVLLAAALLAAPATAVVWRTDLTDEHLIVADRLATGVGEVARGGVATLIAPDWAITAAHVAQRLKPGDTVRFAGRDHALAEVFIHPEGAPDPKRPRQPPEVDLALLRFAAPVAGGEPFMPYRGRDELGQQVIIVGYGDFGPAGKPLARGDGRARNVANVVADAGPLRLFVPFDAPPGGEPFEGIGAAGDSGGPLLARPGEGTEFGYKVLGVSSGADGPPGAYGTVDIYTRVSSQMDWIERTAGAFRPAEVLSREAPELPLQALKERISGEVVVYLTVGVDGVPSGLTVLYTNPPGVFEQASLDAVAKWRFKPALMAGKPVARGITQKLEYDLRLE